jgi:hypothetical protein
MAGIVVEIEWCADCGGHALEHHDEWDPEAEEWVQVAPVRCSGWVLGRTTRSDGDTVTVL